MSWRGTIPLVESSIFIEGDIDTVIDWVVRGGVGV